MNIENISEAKLLGMFLLRIEDRIKNLELVKNNRETLNTIKSDAGIFFPLINYPNIEDSIWLGISCELRDKILDMISDHYENEKQKIEKQIKEL